MITLAVTEPEVGTMTLLFPSVALHFTFLMQKDKPISVKKYRDFRTNCREDLNETYETIIPGFSFIRPSISEILDLRNVFKFLIIFNFFYLLGQHCIANAIFS